MIHDEQTNNKLLILFALDKLEMPISDEGLLDMCVQNDWIPYLFCKEAINELCNAGFINKMQSQNCPVLLSLSQDGALCIGQFFKDIPKSLRDEMTAVIKKNRLNYRKKQEFFSDYYRNSDNTYTALLKILDVNTIIYETRLTLPDNQTARQVAEIWPEHGAEIYKNLYETLISDQ